jgi:hypothetical protein
MSTNDYLIKLAVQEKQIEQLQKENEHLNNQLMEQINSNQEWAEFFFNFHEVQDTGVLPDGDHINIPTQLWLDNMMQKLNKALKGGE